MDATFIFLMLVLKLPILALFYIVWWAVHSTPEEADGGSEDEGGTRRPLHPRHPRPPRPVRPRRGPHGDPPLPAPSRSRPLVARGRRVASRRHAGS